MSKKKTKIIKYPTESEMNGISPFYPYDSPEAANLRGDNLHTNTQWLQERIAKLQAELNKTKEELKEAEASIIRGCENWKTLYCEVKKKLDAVE
ncbi:MAG: hypothetical protein ACUZ9M_00800 [Candidatus Scalindua sp.]